MTTHHTGPAPLPQTTIHSNTPITSSAAHDFLCAYLDRATTDPALQPDASITEHGPTSRTTASAPNLALHNLKRVQAGLAGEVLGKDLAIGEDGNLRGDDVEGEGWEDAKRYEQGQEPVESRAEEEEEEEGGEGEGEGEGDGMQGVEEGTVDKEERKRRKKERRLAEKRAKSGAGPAAAA